MFTPVSSSFGGILLCYSTSALLVTQGRVLGCSGVAHGAVNSLVKSLGTETTHADDKNKSRANSSASHDADGWKLATLGGLVAGGALLRLLRPELEKVVGAAIFDAPMSIAQVGVARTVIAGLLVGAGTKLANGCTSGHMLLGLARLSKRSLAAVVSFFSAALVTSRLAPTGLMLDKSIPVFRSSPSSTAVALFALPILLSLPPLWTSLTSRRPLSPRVAKLQAFFLGMTFSLGLALAGMTRPSKVLSFFAVPLPFLPSPPPTAAWDPSLAMVALGGLLPNMAVWQAVEDWKKPLGADKWSVPRGGNVDAQLLLGSVAFGIGWGLVGICPGPLFAVLGAGPAIGGSAIAAFTAAFALGGIAASRAVDSSPAQ